MCLSSLLSARIDPLGLTLAAATCASCISITGGVPHATTDPTTDPRKWHMLQHPDIPKGRPIPGGPSVIRVVNPVKDIWRDGWAIARGLSDLSLRNWIEQREHR